VLSAKPEVLDTVKRHLHYYLMVVVMLVAAGCGSGGLGGAGSVSLDQEWQLGDQMAAQVAQQMRVGTDPYVTSIGERLHAQTPLANRPFHFYVVDDPSVNAFAIPGGHIYVNRGLIAQADRANMLAGDVGRVVRALRSPPASSATAGMCRASTSAAMWIPRPSSLCAGEPPAGLARTA